MTLPPLAAENLTEILGFPITNSYVTSTLTVVGFIVFGWVIKRAMSKQVGVAPKGILNFFEAVLEYLLSFMDRVTSNRAKSVKFLPIVGTLFFFIMISNWIGLLPGIGSVGVWQVHGGALELIPIFRPANTDLNMTLAMAIAVVVVSHILGVVAIGFFKYANKFIKLGDIYKAIKSLSPTKILVALIEFVVGIIEVFSEIAKMASLSLRLFGNVFAGEVLMVVLASIFAYILPLPFIALELLVGLVQATVFSMLTLVYLSIATTEVHEHDAVTHREDKAMLEPTPTV